MIGLFFQRLQIKRDDRSLGNGMIRSLRLPVFIDGHDQASSQQAVDMHLGRQRELADAGGCQQGDLILKNAKRAIEDHRMVSLTVMERLGPYPDIRIGAAVDLFRLLQRLPTFHRA